MGRLIIIEGPDGAGKTTLANALRTEAMFAGYPAVWSIHNQPPESGQDPLDLYISQIRAALARPDLTIIDRSFVSELIYGPLYRGGSGVTESQTVVLEAFLHLTPEVQLIAVEADHYVRGHRVLARGEKLDEHFGEVGRRYTKYFQAHTAWTHADSASAIITNKG